MTCSESEIRSGALLIRYTDPDAGTRPIDPCTGYWGSPDIWLQGGFDITTAQVGVANTVKVRVKNISAAAMNDVNVQVWVCDFTLGVSPASGIASAGGSSPLTGFVGTIVPGAAAEISCGPTWTPIASDAELNGGHVCLAANCFADVPQDGGPIPPGVFKFCCDSHHAQRNIAIHAVSSSAAGMSMKFGMFVANPHMQQQKERSEEFAVAIQEVFGPEALGEGEREIIASGKYAELPIYVSEQKTLEYGLEARGCLGILGRGRPTGMLNVSLPPAGRMPLVVRAKFDPGERPGGIHTFDVTQTNGQGEVVGGARIVALIAP